MRKFRHIQKGEGLYSLSEHEIRELDIDFDIQVKGFYILAPLTEKEWKSIIGFSENESTSEKATKP